jgi:hypothetical protein
MKNMTDKKTYKYSKSYFFWQNVKRKMAAFLTYMVYFLLLYLALYLTNELTR